MIRPPLFDGAGFSESRDGDLRADLDARASFSEALGVGSDWATVEQVHGRQMVEVSAPGAHGEADSLWTTRRGLPIAVFTADCFGVVLSSPNAVGVAHAGWRGAAAGVVGSLRQQMAESGEEPIRASVGPGIGSCCFEVGAEVLAEFPTDGSRTSWDTRSVDLRAAILRDLEGLDAWVSDQCTYHEDRWFSHRRAGDRARMATVGWVA